MSAPILLDRFGDAEIPSGYLLVESEVAFLRAATKSQPLLIRGTSLCDWAEQFYRGRDIETEPAYSLQQELQTLYPRMELAERQALQGHLAERLRGLPRPLSTASILQTLYPMRLWDETPSTSHAANWLLWLASTPLDAWLHPLLREQAASWHAQSMGVLQEAYKSVHTESANELLKEWLGIAPSNRPWPHFPSNLEIPTSLIQVAEQEWKITLTRTEGEFSTDLLARVLIPTLQRQAISTIASYYSYNPQALSRERYAQLRPYLSLREQQQFERALPPLPLEPFPTDTAQILAWIRDSYLPNRRWVMAHPKPHSTAALNQAAREFSEWYLQMYASALVGSPLQKHLSFWQAQSLRQPNNTLVTLIVVLDGPYLEDAQFLLARLTQQAPRLTLMTDKLAFAPLPTITKFCKPSLTSGLPPNTASDHPALGPTIQQTKSPLDALKKAKSGEVLFWNQKDPDSLYHGPIQDTQLSNEVEGQLGTLANKLVALVEQIPDTLPLRLVLTADHGRLYGYSERIYPVPQGMEAHGRAAWGNSSHSFPESGYLIEGEIAYLESQRFGAGSDLAIALTADAFLDNDGRRGTIRAPHGGLFPEEVVVPWFELIRDFVAPPIEARLSGSSPAGQSGTLTFLLLNAGASTITATQIELEWAGRTEVIPCSVSVPAHNQQTVDLTLTPWPTRAETKSAHAIVHVLLPAGQEFTVPCRVEVESREMYQRNDDLLGDLEL